MRKIMDKKRALFLAIAYSLISIPFASAGILITEVYYDPVQTESGGEAVLLYNPSTEAVNISGWIIATETSATDATLPDSTFLSPGEYYLVADAGFSTSKDNLSWPDADYEEAVTMSNIDAGVALKDKAGNTVDAVGWGSVAGITNNLYEGTPTDIVASGFSIQRKILDNEYQDTENNSADFIAGYPSFIDRLSQENTTIPEGNTTNSTSNITSGNDIGVNTTIINSAPEIVFFSVLNDASQDPGYQVMPLPGENSNIEIEFEIRDDNGFDDIQDIALYLDWQNYSFSVQEQDNLSASFTASITLPYYTEAGVMELGLTIKDQANATATSILQVEVMEFTAVTVNSSITLEGKAGQSPQSSFLIENKGNTELQFGIAATPLQGTGLIPVSNLAYSLDAANWIGMQESFQQIAQPVPTAEELPVYLRVSIPAGTKKGTYLGKILLEI